MSINSSYSSRAQHNAEREYARTHHSAPYVVAVNFTKGVRDFLGAGDAATAVSIAQKGSNGLIYHFGPKERRH